MVDLTRLLSLLLGLELLVDLKIRVLVIHSIRYI